MQNEGPPDLALIDCIMPGVSGFELCIRSAQKNYTYLILVTAKRGIENVIQGIESGADDYISKPFNDLELQVRVKAGMRIMAAQHELQAAHETLEFQASHDGLTRLWNSTAIVDLLGSEISRAERTGTPLSVCLVDLDHFKNVNDRYGHLVGDAVLRTASSQILAVPFAAMTPLAVMAERNFWCYFPGRTSELLRRSASASAAPLREDGLLP